MDEYFSSKGKKNLRVYPNSMNFLDEQINNLLKPTSQVTAGFSKLAAKQKEAMKPFIEIQNSIKKSMESSFSYFKTIFDQMKPYLEIINEEYNVNEEEFNAAVNLLLSKGYFLPFNSTPKAYIRLHEAYITGNLNKKYFELFENSESNFFNANELIKLISEYPLEGWEEPLSFVSTLINESDIESSYKILLPFYFSYLESFFRFDHEDRGKSLRSFRDLVKYAKKNINSSENMSEENKKFYCKIIEATQKYFFSNFDTPEVINRNSVLHGYSTPQHWEKIDFYKVIALLSFFVYLSYDSIASKTIEF